MGTFTIIKKGINNFWHIFNNGGKEVNISDFEVVLDDVTQTFQISMFNGSNVPSNSVSVNDIVIIDQTVSGIPETYVDVNILRSRLVALQYTPYINSGGGGSGVNSVNGQIGDVVLDTSYINDTTDKRYVTDAEILEIAKVSDKQDKLTAGTNITIVGNTINSTGVAVSTDLSLTANPTNNVVTNSNGTGFAIPLANGTNAGLLKPAKFTVLENTSGTNTGDQDLSPYAKYAIARTGSTIKFDTPAIYNSPSSPSTSNLSDDLTGARIGIIQPIYINKAVEPTYPAGWVKIGTGTFTPSTLNMICCEWVGGTRVNYWITKA